MSEIESEAGFLEKWKKGEKGGAAERSIPGAFRLAAPKIEINSREPGATIIIYYGMVLLSDGGVAATPYHGEIAGQALYRSDNHHHMLVHLIYLYNHEASIKRS